MQSNLAPIGISTRSRTHHLKQVRDASKKNLLASDSEVYIFSDAPKSGDKVIVGEVRKYIHTITGFFSINISGLCKTPASISTKDTP